MNVLKSFVKPLFVFSSLASLAIFSRDAFCSTEPEQTKLVGPSPEGLLSMILALLFVVFVIFAIAWVAKRFNLTASNTEHFKMISSMSLGGRERIVVIEVQGEQHAIGVTNQSVNHLFTLEKKIETHTSVLTDKPLLNKINKLFGYQAPNSTRQTKD